MIPAVKRSVCPAQKKHDDKHEVVKVSGIDQKREEDSVSHRTVALIEVADSESSAGATDDSKHKLEFIDHAETRV